VGGGARLRHFHQKSGRGRKNERGNITLQLEKYFLVACRRQIPWKPIGKEEWLIACSGSRTAVRKEKSSAVAWKPLLAAATNAE